MIYFHSRTFLTQSAMTTWLTANSANPAGLTVVGIVYMPQDCKFCLIYSTTSATQLGQDV